MRKTITVLLFGGPAGVSRDFVIDYHPGAKLPVAIQFPFVDKGIKQIAVYVQGDSMSYYFTHVRRGIKKNPDKE